MTMYVVGRMDSHSLGVSLSSAVVFPDCIDTAAANAVDSALQNVQ